MKQLFTLFLAFLISLPLFAQKKQLEHADIPRWRKIEGQKITNDGQWVAYNLTPVTEGDAQLQLWNANTAQTISFPRASEARFTEDNRFLIFRIKPPLDTLKAQRRRKVKEDDLPKDSLGIYTLGSSKLEKIARLKGFTLPEKWSGWLSYQLEPEKPAPAKKDTTANKTPVVSTPAPAPASQDSVKTTKVAKKTPKKPKKEDKENGYRLFVRNLNTGVEDTFAYVLNYTLAKRSPMLLLQSTGKGDSLAFKARPDALQNGIYAFDPATRQVRPLWRGKGKFQQLSLDDSGTKAAFLADLDTSKARIRPWQLMTALARDSAHLCVGAQSTVLQSGNYLLSEFYKPVFSDNGDKLYFGLAAQPVLSDTTLLPEEIVNVEVWAWNQGHIYTEDKNRLESDKKRAFPAVWRISENKLLALGSPDMPELRFQEQRNADMALGFTEEPYAQYNSWEGSPHKDLFAVNLKTGAKKQIVKDLRCNPRLSPEARYISWWSAPDTAWFAWSALTEKTLRLSDNKWAPFYDELTDVPDLPDTHGMAAWMSNDEAMLIYDRYDIWKVDPSGQKMAQRLTRGREAHIKYRYLKLDPEEYSIAPNARILLHQFNEETKAEGYAWLDLKSGVLTPWIGGNFAYNRAPVKAKDSAALLFTKENFQVFPDLLYLNAGPVAKAVEPIRVSNANPQQQEYRWGTIEPIHWTSLTGQKLDGLLVKPEDFDPTKQYPMLVNFYERQSDELNRHRMPDFGRSTINWTFYASRGYLIFIPDIPYRIGYPGESAYDAIVSGTTALLDKGFVKRDKVALQGHSWGGYQTAYLVTRTNLFACAEAGAPVANMTSAYGGIRWESGLSRAFQYERQQSRIGGTLWQYPMRYLENSPLFALDKVETPLLILHNDKDGAVPWQQGIELFSGLRRLGKPTWLLNYNDEPHWPVKLQNRMDFQKRMQQFFDYYLLGAPQPKWMQRGVPPIEKGILQGLETGN